MPLCTHVATRCLQLEGPTPFSCHRRSFPQKWWKCPEIYTCAVPDAFGPTRSAINVFVLFVGFPIHLFLGGTRLQMPCLVPLPYNNTHVNFDKMDTSRDNAFLGRPSRRHYQVCRYLNFLGSDEKRAASTFQDATDIMF